MNGNKGHWGKTVRGTWAWHRSDGCPIEDAQDRLLEAGLGWALEQGDLFLQSGTEVLISGPGELRLAGGIAELARRAAAVTGWTLVDQGGGVFSLFHPRSRFLMGGERKWWLCPPVEGQRCAAG